MYTNEKTGFNILVGNGLLSCVVDPFMRPIEKSASAWLTQEGYNKPSNMTAVEAQNQIMKNLQSIGNANAGAQIMHDGNAQNFLKGSQAQSSQSMNKTAGMGASVDMASAGSVAFEDGEVMGSMVNKTAELRSGSSSYDTEAVGSGQAISQFGKDMGSAALSQLDGAAQATVANATNAVANQVGAGQGLLATGAFNQDGTLAMNGKTGDLIAGAALSSLQKANNQIGMGQTGNFDDFAETALEDGRIAGKTVNVTNARRNQLDGRNGTEAWDEDRIADGQAISATQQQIKSQGVSNSLEKEGQDNGDAFRQAAMGSEFAGRKEENDLLGIGKKWTGLTNNGANGDIALMAKAQDNAAVAAIGGIEAAHKMVERAGGVDGAIRAGNVLADEKAISSMAHVDNLTKDYGENLDGYKTVGQQAINAAQKKKDAALEDLNDAISNGGFDMEDPEDRRRYNTLTQDLKDAENTLDNTKIQSMSLSQVSSAIDQSKIDSMAGQAAGIVANKAAGVDYGVNAMYGEMSSQQSTKAKLDAQGGVEGAVKVDTTEASIKAKTQEDVLDAQLKQGGAKDGLDSSVKSLAQATDKLAQTAGTLAGGKTASDIAGTGKYDSPAQYAEAQAKAASAEASKAKAKMLLDKDQEANEKMATNMLYRAGEGYVGDEKKEKVAQAAKQMEKAGLLERNEKGDLVASAGTKFSDAMAVLNSGDMGRDSQVQVAGTSMNIDRDMDGNTRIAATSKESVDRGESLDYSVSGYMGAVGVGALMGVGAVGAANQYSKHMAAEKVPMKMSDMQGAKPDGNGGFVDSKGNGFGLNSKGEVVRDGKVAMKDNPNYKKGFIKSGWDDILNSATNKYDDLVGGESSSKSSNSSSNSANNVGDNPAPDNDTNKGSQSNKNNVTQGTPPNDVSSNSKDSIAKNEKSGNTYSVAEQIERETKYQKTRDAMVEHNEKVNALNNGGTPEMLKKQQMELSALDGAQEQYRKNASPTTSNKGFFSSRIDAVKDAFGQSKGGFLKTTGLLFRGLIQKNQHMS